MKIPTIHIILVALIVLTALLASSPAAAAGRGKRAARQAQGLNVIDRCWRRDPLWRTRRSRLAQCSLGFAGKMSGNSGRGTVMYTVTSPEDDPVRPRPGTLRYGATVVKGKVWITFRRDMVISLRSTLLISSFTTIDGRGARVQIGGNACLTVFQASNVIIHGLEIHHCRPQPPSKVMSPAGHVVPLGPVDGDAIRVIGAWKVWIDHNTLHHCHDGLVDVTRGSTDITVSNNWFRDQDKVMLLGHDDGYVRDRNMRVTVVYNNFGPNCNQRMPRVRHGYAHVTNNMYRGWAQYAIGGSMNPSVMSEANLFIAPVSGNKEVTSRMSGSGNGKQWNFYSVRDAFENGASFARSGRGGAAPKYNRLQSFRVADAKFVRSMTSSAGALRCATRRRMC